MTKLRSRVRYPLLAMVGLTLIAVFSFFSASAAGNTYYVATNGNDANPGTITQPWRTIQKAVNTVVSGSTIQVRGGTYYESVNFTRSGVSGSPITLSAYPSETVVIDGGSNPAISDERGTKHWVVQGFILQSASQFVVNHDAWMVGTSYWTLRN